MSDMKIDTLTNLFNNKALLEKLKSSNCITYFLLNIDNFSNINNAYGYDIGNALLREVANYLNIIKPKSAKLYRFCSDKFVIIDENRLSKEKISTVSESILSFFSQTEIEVDDDIMIKVSFTIGISQASGLINITQSELAIKETRTVQRSYYTLFDPSSLYIHNEQQNLQWMHKIKDAIVDEAIVSFYQPIINNHTGKVEKYECLARIEDDEEIISPYHFLEAARLTSNIAYVTKAVIAQSFKKFANTSYEFSINITSEDLQLNYLENYLLKNVAKYNINPSRVVLEILEEISTISDVSTLNQLNALRLNGFQIAIDDFGAENSNFSRLLDIEPNYIKIDGVFIKNILTDEKSQVIVDAIIMVCRKRGIKIIAEYIHSKEVQEKVKELGIDYSQGFYFGAPSKDLLVENFNN